MFDSKGVFIKLKTRLDSNRLGELLVSKSTITQQQLNAALAGQKDQDKPLGRYLCDAGVVSKTQLRKTLAEQMMYRALAAGVTLYVSAMSFGSMKAAKAETVRAKTSFAQKVSYQPSATNEFRVASLQTAPRLYKAPAKRSMDTTRLFGSKEVRSTNTAAFTKWNGVIGKLDNAGMNAWNKDLEGLRNAPLAQKVSAVNKYVNQVRYIEDKNNWSKSDYWATPAEFFARGGDCEDFAIAKYAALKQLGVSEDRMRLAIVQDKIKNIPHAILIVYTDQGAMMLDNQIKTTENVANVSRYKPIYSINRQAWWRHLS